MSSQGKTHYSCADLAKMKLPGLPGSERRMRDLVERESWTYIEEKSRGRTGATRLYAPPARILKLIDHHQQFEAQNTDAVGALQAIEDAARTGCLEGRHHETEEQRARDDLKLSRYSAGLELLKRFPTITDPVRERALARLEIVQKYHQFAKKGGRRPGTKALNEFAQNYSSNGAGCLDSTRAAVKKTTGRNLRRWVDDFRLEGLAGLIDEKDGKALLGHGKIEDQAEMKAFVVGMLVEHPRIKDVHIEQALGAHFGDRLAPVTWTLKQAQANGLLARPEISAIRRFREKWQAENAGVRTALMNPDKWKNEQMLAFGDASGDVTHPNYRWEVDSTPGDILLLDDESATGVARYSVLGVLDVFTRRLKLLVAKTSKSIAIGALIRRAIMDWGVPERRKADNGQDYQAQYLNIFFDAIGTEREDCAPFSGWQKAHMERAFRTLSHGLLELMPGFIGHNVAERKEIEARASFSERLFQKDGVLEVRMKPADFQQWCDDWCENVYHHAGHAGLEGKSPFEVITAWQAPIKCIDDERALDILLAPLTGTNGGYFSLQKKGIRIQKHWYIAPELGTRTVGERFQIRDDVADIGRKHAFDADGHFVCIVQCPELTGVSQAEIANKAKAIQRETIKEQKKRLKDIARKANVKDIASEIMRDRAMAAGKLVAFPKASVTHRNSALDEAARAADRLEGQIGQIAPDAGVIVPTAVDVPAAQGPIPATPDARYHKWIDLHARVTSGMQIPEFEIDQVARFYKTWAGGPEGKAMLKKHAPQKETSKPAPTGLLAFIR